MPHAPDSDAMPCKPGASGIKNLLDILLEFLQLGLTSFGGPIAHLGYFREHFVVRKKWMTDQEFTDLVALCQFLPGPASSQTGFAIGVMRGGLLGGLLAWTGFTLPSVLLLLAFAQGVAFWSGELAGGVIHGLKIVAVAVVAQAVWGMAHSFCTNRVHASLAIAAVTITAILGGSAGQLLAIGLGALIGIIFYKIDPPSSEDHIISSTRIVPKWAGSIALGLAGLFLVLSFMPMHSQAMALFSAFYRAGALVFGGGHVILPLLDASTVATGWVSPDAFLAGYGAAQAVPGPLFSFAAYLGAVSHIPPNGLIGALIALVGIFLPGLLLVYGLLPFWAALRQYGHIRAALSGVNASVVGILLSALYHPVWTSAIIAPQDFALACAAVLLLMVWNLPPWAIVLLTGTVSVLMVALH